MQNHNVSITTKQGLLNLRQANKVIFFRGTTGESQKNELDKIVPFQYFLGIAFNWTNKDVNYLLFNNSGSGQLSVGFVGANATDITASNFKKFTYA